MSRASRIILRPIGGHTLELQSHGKVSIGKPLTVHHASESSQVAHERTYHQPLVELSSPLGDDAHPQRAHVLRSRPLGSGGVQDAGNLQGHRQRNALFKSSRPRRHF